MTASEYVVKELKKAQAKVGRLEKHNKILLDALIKAETSFGNIVEKMEVYQSDYFGKCYKIDVIAINEKETPELVKLIDDYIQFKKEIEPEETEENG